MAKAMFSAVTYSETWDRRVDADHVTCRVHERSLRILRADGGVGLEEGAHGLGVGAGAGRDRATGGRDDAVVTVGPPVTRA